MTFTTLNKAHLISAAVSGLIGAATAVATPPSSANATAKTAKGNSPPPKSQPADSTTGQCLGANACSGKSKCHTEKNACMGQNSCKGKGWLETTKAECDKMKKTNAKVEFKAGATGM